LANKTGRLTYRKTAKEGTCQIATYSL